MRSVTLVTSAVVAVVCTAALLGLAVRDGSLGLDGFEQTTAEGWIPEGDPASLDDDIPAITNLDPALEEALAGASEAAALDGLPMEITSGWRSAQYQQDLFDEAVRTYGSEEVARQIVATPESSSHVTGDAVDIGPLDMQFWLMQRGAEWGLCQTYANERWHWELATTPGGVCPAMLPDASAPR